MAAFATQGAPAAGDLGMHDAAGRQFLAAVPTTGVDRLHGFAGGCDAGAAAGWRVAGILKLLPWSTLGSGGSSCARANTIRWMHAASEPARIATPNQATGCRYQR